MLTKRQFIVVLISGSLVFVLMFGLYYTYFYKTGVKDPLVQQDVIEVIQPVQSGQVIPAEVLPKGPEVTRETEVSIQVVSQGDVIETYTLDPQVLIGLTKEQVQAYYSAYDIIAFNTQEVILQKTITQMIPQPSYSIGVQGESIGIIEEGETKHFVPLQLSAQDFSEVALDLMAEEQISITAQEKQKLQHNPYYIEAILQNYNQE